MKLPRYNPEATCCKCGHNEITSRYHREGATLRDCGLHQYKGECPKIEQEHIYRCCRRCGWDWQEEVVALP